MPKLRLLRYLSKFSFVFDLVWIELLLSCKNPDCYKTFKLSFKIQSFGAMGKKSVHEEHLFETRSSKIF